jgi:hypothetical protein
MSDLAWHGDENPCTGRKDANCFKVAATSYTARNVKAAWKSDQEKTTKSSGLCHFTSHLRP